jgi:hypothetical protein
VDVIGLELLVYVYVVQDPRKQDTGVLSSFRQFLLMAFNAA